MWVSYPRWPAPHVDMVGKEPETLSDGTNPAADGSGPGGGSRLGFSILLLASDRVVSVS